METMDKGLKFYLQLINYFSTEKRKSPLTDSETQTSIMENTNNTNMNSTQTLNEEKTPVFFPVTNYNA